MKYPMNKKHPIAFLVAALLACQPISAYAVTFADMNNVPWPGAETSIQKAADLGLIVGETINGKSYFKPKDPVSLSETCQFAYKVMLQTGKATADSSVTEKWATVMNTYKIQSWAHPAVSFCLENGIVSISDLSGFVSGETNKSATREQAAEILGRALEVGVPSSKATATTTKFLDNASISADARPYIALLNTEGIVNGDDLGKFNPKNTLNRTETAVMVTNLHKVLNSAVTVVTPTSSTQEGKVASLTNFYVNLENSTSYYLFSSSGITATLNGESTTISALVTLFKDGGAMEAKLTMDSSSRVTKMEVTSGDVTEAKATEGKLTSVTYDDDDNDGTITLESKHTYKIKDADNIVIEIDDEDDYELDDLDELFDECKANDEYIEVVLTLDKDGEIKKIVGTIKSESDEVKGVLTDIEYDEDEKEGELEIDDKDDYIFDDETSIKIDGSSADWDDLIDLFDDYYSDDKELRVTLTLDGDYAESIVANKSSSSNSSSTKGEISDMDNKGNDKGAIQLKDSKKYTIADVDDLEIQVIDGDEEIDNWDDLYTAQIDDNKTIEVELEFDDDVLVGIKGEVVWVKGLLVDYDSDYLTIKGKESGSNVDYEFDDDESDMKKISVKNLKSSISNMKDLMDYFKDKVESDSSYDVEDEEWTLKLTLKDGYITKVEKG